jgi:hypothetical protein
MRGSGAASINLTSIRRGRAASSRTRPCRFDGCRSGSIRTGHSNRAPSLPRRIAGPSRGVGLDLVLTALAPNDQPDAGSGCGTQRHRRAWLRSYSFCARGSRRLDRVARVGERDPRSWRLHRKSRNVEASPSLAAKVDAETNDRTRKLIERFCAAVILNPCHSPLCICPLTQFGVCRVPRICAR